MHPYFSQDWELQPVIIYIHRSQILKNKILSSLIHVYLKYGNESLKEVWTLLLS